MGLIDFKSGNSSYERPTMPTIQVSNAKRRCEACKTNPTTNDNKTTAVGNICRKISSSKHYIRASKSCYLRYFGDPSGNDEENDDLDEDDRQRPSTSKGLPPKRRRHSINALKYII
ncbi:unnamed protein product [Hermetia illucens]|uniref:Uncharacterized protein n=1 Tax=Hermetia illucens TaxID=343691 RepID=A0A7R8UIJ1_HERIL|nr:uncharacterized protein LOC119649753 [Hermetia illucens]CAD7081500.1 unnamed protein product [Hermetia illucens]